ncbi:MAG TPA: DNA-3-methyladenine glycosylase [Verrucomicrobiae bacterium]|nr:DNA-3-methyladenine glycosylase [Verrucomicrobiae bacterium]
MPRKKKSSADSTALPAQLRAAERHLSRVDPVMARLIKRHGPCRLGERRRDPFHVLCSSVVSQQLSTKAADTIAKRLELLLGAKPHLQPADFATVTHEQLRGVGLSNAKARWLVEIARRTHAGEFSFAALDALDDEAAIEMLDALPGIGRWSAEMYLMFALVRLDLYSLGDLGLRRGVNVLYNKGRPLSDKRTLKLAERWSPYRTVASWYLWRSGEETTDSW